MATALSDNIVPEFEIDHGGHIVGLDGFWQRPVTTEYSAYLSVVANPLPNGWTYIAFPWATLIDAEQTGSSAFSAVAVHFLRLKGRLESSDLEAGICTVCQHIHWRKFYHRFLELGVTDLFVPHLFVEDYQVYGDIRLHPFPLFPAQTHYELTHTVRPLSAAHRVIGASFIGAYNPSLYISNMRRLIFDDEHRPSDWMVKERGGWHFEKDVYKTQMSSERVKYEDESRANSEAREYVDVLRKSSFSLCPTGSGPSSIRIYESIALNVIPIVLSQNLVLPRVVDADGDLWLSFSDDEEGYEQAKEAISSMSENEIQEYLKRGVLFGDSLMPQNWGSLIVQSLMNASPLRAA